MQPRSASFCQKNGRACCQARRRRASSGRDGPVGTAGLFDRQRGSQDDPLSIMPTAGHRTSDASARSRPRTEALRLSAIVHPAAPGRRTVRDQPHLPALPRRGPDGAQAAVAAARSGNAGANRRRGGRQRPLVSGFRP